MDPASTETDVQPQVRPGEGEGRGQGGEGLGLYDLSEVPEELWPFVAEQAKKIEGNVTRRFQEHAEERERWEPFTKIDGLADVPGEELAELMEFRQMASDPEQFEQWWNEIGDELGLFDEDEEDEDEFGAAAEGDSPEVTALKEQINELREQLEPIKAHQASTAQEQRVEEAKRQIRSDLDALKSEHGETDPTKVEEIEVAVIKLAHAYPDDPDAIKKAYADLEQIRGGAQTGLLESKLDQPGQTVNGGNPDTSPPKFKLGSSELRDAARARVAAGG